MRRDGIEDHTLLWVDSSKRDEGGTGSQYSVTMVEPLRNVVGIRVLEATIPATLMSIEDYNSQLVVHTVGFPSACPVAHATVLQAYTASVPGSAWRAHGPEDKQSIFDPSHDSEHFFKHNIVRMFAGQDPSAIHDPPPGSSASEYVLCVVPGEHAAELANHAAVYDAESQTTVVVCEQSETMVKLCDVELVAGVYTLPRGKYDSMQDFVSELKHEYSDQQRGVSLDFIQPLTDKPARSMRMKLVPSRIWTDVDVDNLGFNHSYFSPDVTSTWCAVWTGSNALETLGFHANPVTLMTEGGSFTCSDPQERYKGHLRGASLANLSGERYVWLRCPEVEQHMCAGVGQVLQRGIGVFRLDAPGVFKEESTEYISTIPRQFHPIAKLSKLSFRFDMGRREQSYDFRSVSHFMLLSISTLKPDREKRLYDTLPKCLQPDYMPNALHFELRHQERKIGSVNPLLNSKQESEVIKAHNSTLANSSLTLK